MFNSFATEIHTPFNNVLFSAGTMPAMKEDFARLMHAAKTLHPKRVRNQVTLADFLDRMAPQVLTNWKRRGIPKEQITWLSRKIGCNADWLEINAGEMTGPSAPTEQDATECAQNEQVSLGEIDARLAELEAIIHASANLARVPQELLVEPMNEMLARLRAAIIGESHTGDAHPQSESDERGLGQQTPSGPVRFVPAQAGVVNAWNGADRRHGQGRRRSN